MSADIRQLPDLDSKSVIDLLEEALVEAKSRPMRGAMVFTIEAGPDMRTDLRFVGLTHLEEVGVLGTAMHSSAARSRK